MVNNNLSISVHALSMHMLTLLSDWLPYQDLRAQSTLLFLSMAESRERSWMHTFPMGIILIWNVNSSRLGKATILGEEKNSEFKPVYYILKLTL